VVESAKKKRNVSGKKRNGKRTETGERKLETGNRKVFQDGLARQPLPLESCFAKNFNVKAYIFRYSPFQFLHNAGCRKTRAREEVAPR
jgi:hypothetical protein